MTPEDIPTYGNFPSSINDERAVYYKKLYKMPVIAWVITRCNKSNGSGFFINCDSVVVDGGEPDGSVSVTDEEYRMNDDVIQIIPAVPGTFRVYGVVGDGRSDEIIGHIIPEK